MSAADTASSGALVSVIDTGPPPADGPAVRPVSTALPATTLFLVTYCDETFAFTEGAWGRFGRDDDVCDIPVWEEINERRLSRVAGEFWCDRGDLWLRNLSASHELVLSGSVGAPAWLPRRVTGYHGSACTITGRFAKITAPSTGSWQIGVERLAAPMEPQDQAGTERHTVQVGPVPPRLMPVAAALCEPLLDCRDSPAHYEEIGAALGVSRRQARRYVEQLCTYYSEHGVDLHSSEPHTVAYVRLAHLLVNRARVTPEDVQRCLHGSPDSAGENS